MNPMEHIAHLRTILDDAHNIVFFTGAGISVPSGIPDFRSPGGLYMQREFDGASPEEIISHTYFCNHPARFYRFYREKMLYPDAAPNAAHRWIASLANGSREVSVVTQNIDGLHEAAGSPVVHTLHGTVHRNFCTHCRKLYSLPALLALFDNDGIPRCPHDGAMLKPDVVLYEEPLDGAVIEAAIDAISAADTMIIIGTSLVVYPAASFVRYFRGKHLVLINKTETPYDDMAELAIYDDVVSVVSALNASEAH